MPSPLIRPLTVPNLAEAMHWTPDFSAYITWWIIQATADSANYGRSSFSPVSDVEKFADVGGALRKRLLPQLRTIFRDDYPDVESWTISWRRWAIDIGHPAPSNSLIVFNRTNSGRYSRSGWEPGLLTGDSGDLSRLAEFDGARSLEAWLDHLNIPVQAIPDGYCRKQVIDYLNSRIFLPLSAQLSKLAGRDYPLVMHLRQDVPARTAFRDLLTRINGNLSIADAIDDHMAMDDATVLDEELAFREALIEWLPAYVHWRLHNPHEMVDLVQSVQYLVASCIMAIESNPDNARYIGLSPAGVEWTAYREDNILPMTRRLVALWNHHLTTRQPERGGPTSRVMNIAVIDYANYDPGANYYGTSADNPVVAIPATYFAVQGRTWLDSTLLALLAAKRIGFSNPVVYADRDVHPDERTEPASII